MKVFFDFEFTGLHKKTTPISLAMMSQDGHEFYAEFTDYDKDQIDGWLIANVLQQLVLPDRMSELAGNIGTVFINGTTPEIAEAAEAWLKQLGRVQMVGDCLAYDWVLFCDLFGGARSLPEFIDYIPVELCTVLEMCRIDPDVNRDDLLGVMGYPGNESVCLQLRADGLKHNALHDVRVMASIWTGLEFESSRQLNCIRPEFFRKADQS